MSDPAEDGRFHAAYERSVDDVRRFVRRRVDAAEVEDVVAETFLVVWRRVEALPRGDDAARAWIFGVARNVLLSQQRGERRQQAVAVRIADAQPRVTLDQTDGVVDHILLVQSWRRLPETHQETLALLLWDGLTPAQAAAVLGIRSVTFRLRLSRARKALRAQLDPAVAPVRPLPDRKSELNEQEVMP